MFMHMRAHANATLTGEFLFIQTGRSLLGCAVELIAEQHTYIRTHARTHIHMRTESMA